MDTTYAVRYTLPTIRGTFTIKVVAGTEAEARDTARWALDTRYMPDAKITSVKPVARKV